ncbi:type I-E CRISPR-associated endoribonuclease Cas2e [Corynebacterium pseudodiphtheriticum]|uniref:type I-E CRISPR-associated endoribonuclease Cas2e n=1 Tax=Corynebacterium pseudodiphtheriticum TaxID=37637 RepID=UPI0024BEB3D5|nr:type I-E CRISPR-associated endoribonuclease Cas2e [Corynebacterium pseudodiphtheriticum]
MFLVLTSTYLPDHLRGYLSRFLIEVDSGIYVGNISRRVRDNIWKRCAEAIDRGSLTMINSDSSREQGFAVNTLGPQRKNIIDLDGMLLPATLSAVASQNDAER